jgi:hypothetical protein
LFGAFSWAGIGVIGGGDGSFSFGAFSCDGIGAVGGGNSGCSCGALSWTGIGAAGDGEGGFFFKTGIGVVGGGDGFLSKTFPCAVGRAPSFWKYKLQVIDRPMR